MTVHIEPLSPGLRAIPARWRPQVPPIFPDGPPTPADVELARELYLLLDAESRRWYGRCRIFDSLPGL